MCGIAGFNWSDKQLIGQMTKSLAHRGPDAQGSFVDNHVSLGHLRLAVVDLSPKGNQPMQYRHWVLVFNGEIFNYRTLRQQLQKKGHTFKSQSDTEVILHAYAQWGSRAVTKFNGQWALAIYDRHQKQMFLSRDRFGIKPLYWAQQAGQFIFASEIKAIRQHNLYLAYDLQGLNAYWYQKYIPGELSLFQQIRSLLPGHNAVYKLDTHQLTVRPYYRLDAEINRAGELDLEERIDQIKALLPMTVADRLVADVPVGTFLSGGLDSSLVSAYAHTVKPDLKTFSISFAQKSYDESDYAQSVADQLQTQHHNIQLKVDDQLIERVLVHLDQPFGDSSIIPTYVLSRQTRRQVTVALSGDGADEVFGGYDTYRAYLWAKLLPAPFLYGLKPLSYLLPVSRQKVTSAFLVKRFLGRYHSDDQMRHLQNMATFPDRDRLRLLLQGWVDIQAVFSHNQRKDVSQVQQLDMEHYLPGNILVKTDLASMFSSLEVRLPYLDYRLVPLVLSLPQAQKLDLYSGKKLLKTIAQEYLPNHIVHRTKRGFTVPLASWFASSQFLKEYVLSEAYYGHLIVSRVRVEELWRQHQAGFKDNSRELWLVAVFNYWWSKTGRSVSV